MTYNKEEMFGEAAQHWDLERLYQALGEAKRKMSPRSRKGLTATERLYLRGLLCGYSPAEMARKLFQSTKGLEVYMSKTLYQYFKSLVDVPSEKLGNWRNILSGLEDAGYKAELSPQSKSRNYRQIEPLVNIVNIGLETNNTITIDIKVRLELPSASAPETPEEESIDEEEEETDRP
ncbi:MAG: hypothetical protein Fur0025_02270 [Oscillatoriaceae cyanobacterium]